VCRAARMSDGMFLAGARALASLADPTDHTKGLLPQVSQLREVSATVAVAVVQAAIAEGLNRLAVDSPIEAVQEAIWSPSYLPIRTH
jgi:malate dehydrogenase (oxaloacetate-decarboxylating)